LRRWWVLGLLMALIVSMAPAVAQKTISISAITADLSFTKDYSAISQGDNLTITLNLPFTLESLNNTDSNITIVADSGTDSTTINLTVNGVAVATNYNISGGSSATWTFPDIAYVNIGALSDVYRLLDSVEAVDIVELNLWLTELNLCYSVAEVCNYWHIVAC